MLLLVLILVLVAFGLLVFALQAQSVVWALVSVGVSVVAGLVLLVDWLQRRAETRAGVASLEAAGTRPPSPDQQPEPEPATEVLPVVPPAGAPPGAEAPTAVAARPTAGAADDVDDSEQTVLMPVVEPSGSPARPSGAPDGTTGSSESSSRSVTDGPSRAGADIPAGSTGAASDPAAGDTDGDGEVAAEDAGPEGGAAGGEPAAGKVDIRKRPSGEKAAEEDETAEEAAASAPAAAEAGEEPADSGSGQPAAAKDEPAVAAQQPGARSGDSNLSGPDLFGSGELPQQPAQHAPQQPVEQPPQQFAQQPPNGQWGQPPAGGWPPQQQAAAEVPLDPPPPYVPEPPLEVSEPAEAALVATLEDEVVVVDEQPRYHVPGCEALNAQEPIPLPAREAVELGFTPCGWCRPDHTLASRYPAHTR
ncbi:hypothetical protein SAMN05443637_11371 [Pseudonocardia thermophila]|uniref:Uncharacterized protein n=1 Tax=Pseudonocardia thermophila TaxID=1848 RepID=A0A1M6VUZ9_PSETH|nr:hypothetical protein [Pseudonocardia thermophila]SHK85372.1 hypothetical protein SAMN05443637_11371 [Pseudonocardia thermophila]